MPKNANKQNAREMSASILFALRLALGEFASKNRHPYK